LISSTVHSACVKKCWHFPAQANSDKEAVPVGHFISASISWVKDEASADENAVIFEVSASQPF
jgi:hypothetical protein